MPKLVYVDYRELQNLAIHSDCEDIALIDEIADYFDGYGCRAENGFKCDCHVCEG